MTALSTHDTKRGEDVRARIAVLAEIPEDVAALGDRQLLELAPVARPRLRRTCCGRRSSGAWPIDRRASACTPTPRRRCARPATAPRGPTPTRTTRRAVHAAVDAAFDDARVRRGRSRQSSPTWRRPAGATRWPPSWSQLTAARRPGRVPGQRAVGAEPGRSRQPPRRSTSRCASDCCPLAAGRPRRRTRRRAEAAASRTGRCACVVTGRSCSTDVPAARAHGPRRRARARLRPRRAVAVATGCPSASSAAAAGATTALDLPPARWVDLMTGTVVAAPAVAVADLLPTAGRAAGGGAAQPRGTRPLRRLGAPTPRERAARPATGVVPMERGRRRTGGVRESRREPVGEVDYGFLLDDDDTPRPRPAVAAAAGGRARPLAGPSTRPHSRGATTAWTGRQLAGGVDLRAARRHLHPRGHARRGDRPARPPRRVGVDLVELMPVNAFNGEHNWGYDGVLWFAVHEPYGGPAALPALRRRLPARGLGVDPGRRVQPPRAVAATTCRSSAPTSPTGDTPWGAQVNLDQDGLRRGAPAHPRQRADVVRATSTSTGCGSTPCTRSRTAPRPHLLEEMATEAAALSAHLRPAADPDRGVRPQRPAPDHAARGRRLRARRPVERRLPPRAARGADRRDRRLLRRLRAARRAGQGAASGASSTTARGRRSAAASTACRSTSTACRRWRLVVASQNHDQVGNRARGDRLTEHARRRTSSRSPRCSR